MENSTVIVALPALDDPVYKYSSEKVPHLTLLLLGDLSAHDQLEDIVGFVGHAASTLHHFGLPVDRRGTLGDEDADVLFFENGDRYSIGGLKEFRADLLKNPHIKQAYLEQEQFPQWTPHLTMGYPATPAKPDEREYGGFNWVSFDRIAVWLGDFQGPEFRLKDYDIAMEGDVSMSDLEKIGEDFLAHYGTKGMKWGVRKAEKQQATADRNRRVADGTASGTDRVETFLGKGRKGVGGLVSLNQNVAARTADRYDKKAAKTMEKVDKKWEKSIYTTRGAIDVHNDVARQMNNKILPKLNSDPRWKDAAGNEIDMTRPENSAKHEEYMTAYLKEQSAAYASAVQTVHGTSPSGKRTAEYVEYETPYGYEARIEVRKDGNNTEIKHADGSSDKDDDDLVIFAKMSPYGKIIELNGAMGTVTGLEHTALDLDGFLAHYGVKGMKWGVTKADKTGGVETLKEKKSLRNAKDVTVTQKKAGTYVQSKGGDRQKASDDAIKAQAARQKAQKSTRDALTNSELKAVVERMNLEQQYEKLLASQDRKVGESFVKRFFKGATGQSSKAAAAIAKQVADAMKDQA